VKALTILIRSVTATKNSNFYFKEKTEKQTDLTRWLTATQLYTVKPKL